MQQQQRAASGSQGCGSAVAIVSVVVIVTLGVAATALFLALANARSIDDSPEADKGAKIEDVVAAEAAILQEEIVQFQTSVQQQLDALKKKANMSTHGKGASAGSGGAVPASTASSAAGTVLAAAGVAASSQLPRAQLFSSATGNTSGMSRTGVNLATLARQVSLNGRRDVARHAMTDKRVAARERVRREVEDTAYQAAHPGDARKRQSAMQNLKNAMHLDKSAIRAKQKEVRTVNKRLQAREHDGGLYNPKHPEEYARMAALAKSKHLHVAGRNTRGR